jgi:hypothetical protein
MVFFEIIQLLVAETNRYVTVTATSWMKDGYYCMTSLFRKYACFLQLIADGARSG